MKVDINSIREQRGGSIHFKGQQDVAIEDPEHGIQLKEPVDVEGSVTNTGEGFLIQLKLRYEYQANCARCLESFSATQTVEVSEQFIADDPSDDEALFKFRGDIIDLEECITQHVWLTFPIKLLCREDCRGLCVNCGKNLNSQECQCTTDEINPHFEKLRTLLVEKGGGPDGKSKK